MAFQANFNWKGKDHEVLTCTYKLFQEVDTKGHASSIVRGGTIHLTIESSKDTSFFDWMVVPTDYQDGSVQFYEREGVKVIMKQLKFEKGLLVGYEEAFTAETSTPMTQTLTISAEKITFGGVKHDNHWPVK